ncbi:hypothetical protein ACFQYP_43560 [Nonomuraea antimicrobica]
METFADLIECEDVLLFANAAITSTGQREFHSAAGEQRLSSASCTTTCTATTPTCTRRRSRSTSTSTTPP